MELKSKLLLILVAIAVLASVGAAYKHFVIEQNYLLEYEAMCDSSTENCFTYSCEDIEDTSCEPYDYKLMVKNAAEVEATCGTDITSCEAAQSCQSSDSVCEVLYCDPETTSEDMPCSVPPEPELLIESTDETTGEDS